MPVSNNVDLLAARAATEDKALRTLINGNVADLALLTTTDKASLVAALNEVNAAVGAGLVINDAGTTNADVWSAAKITADITAAIDGLISGAPGTLDTIGEIATALQNSPDTINNILVAQAANTTAVTAAQADATQGIADAAAALTAATSANTSATTANTAAGTAQSTADANGLAITALAADVGSPTTDYVGTFNANL